MAEEFPFCIRINGKSVSITRRTILDLSDKDDLYGLQKHGQMTDYLRGLGVDEEDVPKFIDEINVLKDLITRCPNNSFLQD